MILLTRSTADFSNGTASLSTPETSTYRPRSEPSPGLPNAVSLARPLMRRAALLDDRAIALLLDLNA